MMSFMEEIYSREAAKEISPAKSKDKLKERLEKDNQVLKVDCLDNLTEYYDDSYGYCTLKKKRKKKRRKKRKKKKQTELTAKQLANLQQYNDSLDKRVLAVEAKTEVLTQVLTQVLSTVINGKKLLEPNNIIRLNSKEYGDG